MDKFIYFVVVLFCLGYFLIPKISGFESPQIYWQYQIAKIHDSVSNFKDNGGLSQYLPKKFSPQGVKELYQNAIFKELDNLGNIANFK